MTVPAKHSIDEAEDERAFQFVENYLARYDLKRALMEAMKPTAFPEHPDTYSIRFADASETEEDDDALGTPT